jgi:uncharacterized protein YkwD
MALVLVLAGGFAAPAPAAASTSTTSVAAALLSLTNHDRAARGLRPLRRDSRLAFIARDRAVTLAAASTFSHAAAGGTLSATLDRSGVQWYGCAEDLASAPGGLTSYTAAQLYGLWRNSPAHWAALMSRTLNYVGFGIAVRASSGQVFAVADFTESRDHSAPAAKIDRATRSGTTITFTWHGYDAPLQTHWAGLRDFDVWYRVDGGAWRRIRDNTTRTTIRLTSRAHGHRYWLRIQARDRAGNVGRFSAPISIRVP